MTDIPYIRTLDGFAYLAFVIDLLSHRAMGWSMQALHIAVWRCKPKRQVLIHSVQGPQLTSVDWAAFIHFTILSTR